ncbi:MAG: pilus assembly PilX N-terminal domain-containing protein [Deltaproteobacteria bacterium]|nr:pilus assembly PilX N-terminal domain-containing protein [Deltaproteobacteria bacterium]MBW2123463.1 pilus assembly PilX N-terminal domain-containing protein [Deltaproteobacteria bacterium]
MSRAFFDLRNERGTALVIALLVMITATVVALCANFTSTTELAISGNQRRYTTDFFKADGGLELIKSYFFDNFIFPSNVGGQSNVGSDLTGAGYDNSPFVNLGLDTTQTTVTKVYEGNPPRGRGISATKFRGNYYRARSVMPNSVGLEEEFCLISPKAN